jgi:DNA-binding LytR/AlgR family response regulator
MKFTLIVDPEKDEEVVATVHARSPLTDAIESLILQHTGSGQLAAFTEEDITILPYDRIACITVQSSKTFAIDTDGNRFRLRQRLYELESLLPAYFIRINKSALANERQLERFSATFSGGVDAVFKCGYREYVSRRCFSVIKRRYEL